VDGDGFSGQSVNSSLVRYSHSVVSSRLQSPAQTGRSDMKAIRIDQFDSCTGQAATLVFQAAPMKSGLRARSAEQRDTSHFSSSFGGSSCCFNSLSRYICAFLSFS
jgi:hypothetical protein